MSNLSYNLVTDLLSDDCEMLHSGGEVPSQITLYCHPDANEDVKTNMTRIIDVMIKSIDPDCVYAENRQYLSIPNREAGLQITPATLILSVRYQTSVQRVLELTLEGDKAKLHFHK